MKERGVLFSAPMVRAILAGTKTQTRRLFNAEYRVRSTGEILRFPYGQGGDRLWVRETWGFSAKVSTDGTERWLRERDLSYVVYRADEGEQAARWRPSLHMPRWASRITLEIIGVRVERLQDISDDDIRAEGTADWVNNGGQVMAPAPGFDGAVANDDDTITVKPNRVCFASLWDSINAKRAPWSSSPWVWVVTFRRIDPEWMIPEERSTKEVRRA